MKKILLLIISISPFLMGNESIPEKLLLSSKAFTDNPDLYPVYRINLIIFSHKQINEKDKQDLVIKLSSVIMIKINKKGSLNLKSLFTQMIFYNSMKLLTF